MARIVANVSFTILSIIAAIKASITIKVKNTPSYLSVRTSTIVSAFGITILNMITACIAATTSTSPPPLLLQRAVSAPIAAVIAVARTDTSQPSL